MDPNSQIAINAALEQDWAKAVTANEEIIKKNENSIDALSRLAYAYTQLGKIEKAKKLYRTILSLDRYNFIAKKNLDKISSLSGKSQTYIQKKSPAILSPRLFLEEPGKTKSIVLKNVAPTSVISKFRIGDTVTLHPKKHSIEIRDQEKTYIGAIPDDITFRLLRFIKAGNLYHVCVKNTEKNSVSVFIREVKRGKRLFHQSTFPPASGEYTLFTPREIKPAIKEDVDDEENQEEDEE